jgi:hypothetical protein
LQIFAAAIDRDDHLCGPAPARIGFVGLDARLEGGVVGGRKQRCIRYGLRRGCVG